VTAHPVRRAGQGRLPDGSLVVWSVATGRRGRRWREVRTSQDQVVSSLLFETDPAGRFAHLELSTAAGLLTLHPEPDGSLHGNVVVAEGIRHVVGEPWSADGALVLEGSAIAVAAAGERIPAAWIDLGLGLHHGRPPIDRVPGVPLDADGLPKLADGATWPLERDEHGA